MYPLTVQGRGKLLQWTFFVGNEVEPAVIAILRNRIILPPEQRDPVAADEAHDKLRRLLSIMESELQRTGFFAGDARGLTVIVACVLYIVNVRLKMDLGCWPRLGSWTTASVERPAALIARKLRGPL
jgi:glutathione S-transferase